MTNADPTPPAKRADAGASSIDSGDMDNDKDLEALMNLIEQYAEYVEFAPVAKHEQAQDALRSRLSRLLRVERAARELHKNHWKRAADGFSSCETADIDALAAALNKEPSDGE